MYTLYLRVRVPLFGGALCICAFDTHLGVPFVFEVDFVFEVHIYYLRYNLHLHLIVHLMVHFAIAGTLSILRYTFHLGVLFVFCGILYIFGV